ncbi:hypothetical protein [Portibacter marinus]|uniref:hypothetical protein n=1 Tax=Portibacter marinus TaxID=2898660 RepID=UPI001F1BC707|nr:hypothetical protein [Portibacter marinus]
MKPSELLMLKAQFWQRILTMSMIALSTLQIGAQNSTNTISKNAVYFELLGSSFYLYNISYDRAIYVRGKNRLSIALGFQVQDPIRLDASNSISPQINYMYGNIHSFETGIGYAYYAQNINPNGLIFRLGYRYQKKNRLFFKLGITPIITDGFAIIGIPINGDNLYILPWGGISLGYSF